MEKLILYHGSNHIIRKPDYNFQNNHNDYGKGFYCTDDIELAKEWSCRFNLNGVLNKYELDISNLKILDLTDKDKYSVLNWISLLLKYREISNNEKTEYKAELNYLNKFLPNINEYDLIIGYRADDAYFEFPKMFIRNEITLLKLEEIFKLGNLGKQYFIRSRLCFKRIRFISSENVEGFEEKYKLRIKEAKERYLKIKHENKYSKDKKILDLIRGAK